ncbi:MAG: DUF4388 domain-containing protein [Deltaproteobacteria bacterium]|nr:DUF4388 domain-containing protein [Deltaproteobacteria bacterium]
MSIALHGNLRDFGIAEVFQLIGQQRKTGTLVVGEGSEAVYLAFDEGRVVTGGAAQSGGEGGSLGRQLVRAGYLTREQLHDLERESARSARPIVDLLRASGRLEPSELDEVRDLLTRETVFDIMRRKNGEFHFSAEPVDHDLPQERLLGAEQILMDGLRMLDEWQTFSAAVPSEELVFRRLGSLESSRALAQSGGDERLGQIERVLGLVDGRLTVRRVIDLSRIGTFEATRVLAELRQAGLIEVGGEEVRRAPRRRAEPVAVVPRVRAVLATAVPFVVLALLGGGAFEADSANRALPGTAIPDPILGRIGAANERELVRQLLEVHFFATGAYPQRLDELAERAARSGVALTPERLADYYYAVRNDEVVLLAPMN